MIIDEVLSHEAERVLVLRCQSNSESAWEELLEIFDSYIESLARKYWRYARYQYDLDDFLSEAKLAFVRGVRRYDSSRENRLITYVTFWMKQYLLEMRAGKFIIRIPTRRCTGRTDGELPIGRIVSIDAQTRDGGLGRVASIEDKSRDPQTCRDAVSDVQATIALIQEPDRGVLIRRMHDETLESIAISRGVTRERVRQIDVRARKSFRSLYESMTISEES